MSWLDFFGKSESLISLDVGSNSIKLLELDCSGDKPRLLNVGVSPVDFDLFSNNTITKGDRVAELITSLLEANSISDKRVVTAIPGPSVFTKKIKMPKLDPTELRSNIQFEAGNFIPHNIEAVKLDYHIIGEANKNQFDVLVVAVKNEIIDSFLDSFALAGLAVAVVDVDHFALQNMFELNYPELLPKTVALINMGARYSSINIVRNGQSLFIGDIAIGGKLFSDAISEVMGVPADQAENLKKKRTVQSDSKAASDAMGEAIEDILEKNVEYAASEFNRQLSFFWNAAGEDGGIDQIMLTGGGALVPGLLDELSEKTGIECGIINPFKEIEIEETFDSAYLKEIAPVMGVCVGMAIRQPGDRSMPEIE